MSILRRLGTQEILLALGVVSLIMLFFVPLPPVVLDLLFALNITSGLLILLTVLFIDRALEFTSFPMLLLITTTFRLALNVASTKLILADGHQTTAAAGQIIETFGNVVMGGNFVIGLIVFLILIIVNFVVITRGSGRIAEVAARFTLDSLPGKQMAIDADLNAGLIDEHQARKRRSELEQETGFYGAMDGASKFVRGDAIAGLIITGLNIAVGLIIGVTEHGMTLTEAAQRYTLLTVGDGLVAYIPALTISIAAGMLVAKSGTVTNAGSVVFGQLGANDKVLFVSSGLMVLLSLIPGMPVLPFWLIAGALGYAGYLAHKRVPQPTADELAAAEAEAQAAAAAAATPKEEPLANVLHVDTLRLELGYSLLSLIDEARGGRLTDQIRAMRRQMARDTGFVLPSVRIQDNMQLAPGGYQVSIKEISAGEGLLEPGKLLAMDPTGTAPKITGKATIEPTFGLPALWIDEGQKENAAFNGYTVVDPATVIVTHLTEIVKDHLAELLTRTEVEKLLEELKAGPYQKLITDLVPEKIAVGTLQKVLQNLLAERISIRDLATILEAIADSGSRNISVMTEAVRQRLTRQISTQFAGPDGVIPIIALSPKWEQEFQTSILREGEDKQLAMAPEKVQAFMKSARDLFEKHLAAGLQPVLLTSSSTRPFARTLLERALPSVGVLAQSELSPRAKIKTVGSL